MVPGSSGSTPDEAAVLHAPFGYGLVFCPFKAEERVRVPHGVPVSGSSVGQSAALIQRRPGGSIPPRTTGRWDPLILHSHNMSGGVAERYCSSLLASRRFTRGWGFESLRLRIGQQPHPWQLWCNGNTVDRGSAIDGSIPSSCPKALVAQWIAHQFPEQGVAGSSPASGSTFRLRSSTD